MATKIKQSFFRDVNPMKLKPVTSLRSCLFDSVRVISIQTRRNNIASQLKRGTTNLFIERKLVGELWGHVEVLSLVISAHLQKHVPNFTFILLVHT